MQVTKKCKLIKNRFDFWVLKKLDFERTVNEKENKKLFDIIQSKA